MRHLFLLLLLGLGLTSVSRAEEFTPPKTHPDSSAWQELFGKDLAEAVYPQAIWRLEDGGILTAEEDQPIWTRKKYGDFILDLEFKNGPGANSGVFLHCSDQANFVPNSVEVQIADPTFKKWQEAVPSWHCGAIFGRKAPSKQLCKAPGEWNRLTITAKGKKIWVLLNGEVVNEIDLAQYTDSKTNPDGSEVPQFIAPSLDRLEHEGFLGLQGKHGGAPIWFRHLKIKPL